MPVMLIQHRWSATRINAGGSAIFNNSGLDQKLMLTLNNVDYEVCPEGIQPCTMKNRDIIEEDTRNICTQDNAASVPFKVGTLGPHTVLPIAISCPVLFSWVSLMVWNLFPFKGDFGFGKSQKLQSTKSGLWRGWIIWVIWCFTKKLCTRCDAWVGLLLCWRQFLPVFTNIDVGHKRMNACGLRKTVAVLEPRNSTSLWVNLVPECCHTFMSPGTSSISIISKVLLVYFNLLFLRIQPGSNLISLGNLSIFMLWFYSLTLKGKFISLVSRLLVHASIMPIDI